MSNNYARAGGPNILRGSEISVPDRGGSLPEEAQMPKIRRYLVALSVLPKESEAQLQIGVVLND